MEDKKLTKKDKFEILKEIVADAEVENADVLVEFLDNEIAILDKKADKAKENAAKKKADGDDLRARVKEVLTEDYQTIDDILSQVEPKEDEELSKAKIIARLTQLVNNGDAEKADVKTEDNKKVKAYRLVNAE